MLWLFLPFLVSSSLAAVQLYTSNSTFQGSSLSDKCRAALVSSLDCDPDLPSLPLAPSASPLFLDAICTSECALSLGSYRASIQSSCTIDDYLLVSDDHYLPTFPIDYYTYYYNTTCLKTGQSYCADKGGGYYNLTLLYQNVSTYAALPNEMICDPCFLDAAQLQLESPYATTPDLANNWTDILSRCASTMTYTAPDSTFGLPSQYQFSIINETATDLSWCVYGAYAVQSGDTCSTIAKAKSVVVDQLVALNGLDEDCKLLSDRVGSSLCLPQKCSLYTVKANDTCDSIGAAFNLTYAQVLSLNFQLDIACQTLPDHVNSTICVGLSAYSLPTPTQYPVTTATVAAPTPTGVPIAPNTDPAECGEWHVVVGGDTCNQLSINYQLSLADLYQLNPMLNENCTNLFLGYSYCVEGYNVSFVDSPSNTLVGPSAWPSPTNLTYIDPEPAPGTTTVCSTWWIPVTGVSCSEALFLFNITLPELQFWNPSLNPNCDAGLRLDKTLYCVGDGPPLTIAPGTITQGCTAYYAPVSGDSCMSIEATYNVTQAEFIAMNPEIDGACGNLAFGVSYCVATSNTTSGSGPPANVAPGTITAGCTEYHTVVSGDDCASIESMFSLSLAQFIAMNPELNAGCTNLALGDAYCVASSNSTSTGPPANVAPGTITAGCTEYHTVVSGDGCVSIESTFGLSPAQFIAMNPELNAGCTNLALGDAYCVASSNSTSIGPPANVAPGTITAGCTEYHTIVSGDGCANIESMFGLLLAQFIAMNPELNAGCTNLALGDAYCVQSSNSTATGPPSNLAAGSLSNCTTYHTVISGDNCQTMEASSGIAASDFLRWNPEVNSACTNIFAGEAYCVGGGGQACGKLYVVKSGDGCEAIAMSSGITQARLDALNPQVDANCDNLQVGEILCVG
ncbi:hypothetical protein B0H16DRAFT_1547596 [Mycena metata]|uniref:LysM domain-containing protein n=1 Tax=Mycena metata TaxID=1033252 RepID=A0AAD7NA11_9AGAR|nr:hypothetical protein B0H16DRAFT_1547596 [Mycena metata]